MTTFLYRGLPSRRSYLLTLSLLVALGPLTVDLYLPALPALQADLETRPVTVQLTLTATTVGLALGQLIMGPWSDVVGRRRPLLLATGVHVVASLGVALAPDIAWLLACRVLQGVGSAGGAVVAFAIIRDLFTDRAFVRAMARLALITGLTPVLAPTLGAQLLRILDWRGLFFCVTVYGVLVLALVAASLGETLPADRRGGGDWLAVMGRYRRVLADRRFVGTALIGGMMVSGVFAYMTSSSFLLQQVYGLSANSYGLVSAGNAVAFVVGNQAASRVLGRVPARTMLAWTLPLLAGAGFSVALTETLGSGITALVLCTTVFHLAAGASAPCLGLIALADHAARAGTAAALLGAANFGLAGALSPLVGAIGMDSARPVGVAMGLVGTVAVVMLATLVRPPAVETSSASTDRVNDPATR